MLANPDELKQLTDKYSWLMEIDAWTVAIVKGRSTDEIIRIYGGDPATPVGYFGFGEMADLQGRGEPESLRFHMQAFSVGSHVIVLENNGWHGSMPEIARRCSAGEGRFFSVYWNINAFGFVTEAIAGKVAAQFEHLYPLAPQASPHERRPEWAIGPDVDVEVARQTCFALMEQQTGVAFDPYWLGERRPTFRIPDVHWMLRDVPNAENI